MAELIIFYDAGCPLCVSEMRHLMKLDTAGKISLENIHADDFTLRFPHIDQQRADQILHGQLASGEVIYALDVTYNAWAKPYNWQVWRRIRGGGRVHDKPIKKQ